MTNSDTKSGYQVAFGVRLLLDCRVLGGALRGSLPGEVPPTPVPKELYQAVSTGSVFSCGLRLDGSIRCWGRNEANEEKGMLEAPTEGTFVAVASGYYGNCALRDDGRLEVLGPGRRREQTLHEVLSGRHEGLGRLRDKAGRAFEVLGARPQQSVGSPRRDVRGRICGLQLRLCHSDERRVGVLG